ncbi:DUF2931 family protein [Lysobacter soli]|uniref:DUF2931 family protein n=1 Tax=Lysobacter soli TaxID=453783 RepID=UPI0037C7D2FF
MTKRLAVLLLSLVIVSCAPVAHFASLPADYLGWSIGYTAPPYMEVWIETIDVEDVNGRLFRHIGSGTASIAYSGDPAGWRPPRTLGGGRLVRGAALPKHMYVRWQSLVEPQTYHATFDVPERARQLMLEREKREITQAWDYRSYLILDLAPGGWVKAWIRGPAGDKYEVLCEHAEIEAKGPYEGRSGGRHRPLTDRAAPYVAAHPIPYDSWNCAR